MAKTHNKKRNVGLIYEFLVRYMAESLIDGQDDLFNDATNIFKECFRPGTELYREFRLFNALAKTTVSSKSIAASILNEARIAAKNYDYNKLDREKSVLIKKINHKLNKNFYSYSIPEYKSYATIQTLLNDWRDTNVYNIERIAKYEDRVLNLLLQEKNEKTLNEQKDERCNKLVVNLMLEKLNEKYSSNFSKPQKEILNRYVLSNDVSNLKSDLELIQTEAIKSIDDLLTEHEQDTYFFNKLKETKAVVDSYNFNEVNDKSITKSLKLIELLDIVNSEEERHG